MMAIKLLSLPIKKEYLQGNPKHKTSKRKLKISLRIVEYNFKPLSRLRMINLENQAQKCGIFSSNTMEKQTQLNLFIVGMQQVGKTERRKTFPILTCNYWFIQKICFERWNIIFNSIKFVFEREEKSRSPRIQPCNNSPRWKTFCKFR